ncbi:wyosine base formation domain-containing protein [Streptomyces sp. CNQ-509]|uniref:TIGR03084 family metal-binding protein n=1 Tax=unclassified Streptomyces TaxID=2593676 RepID=UPI00062DD8C1|nr:TIGR03084 family metal-binding protein [Streptomyces sp. CNQ-509]AKH83021.1 wyosine base formation domain-containing protein [Streptomyces sp. CNQ-509]
MAGPEIITLLDDLRDESAALDALVAGLPPERWALGTPAAGWTVAHQIAHLAWTDRAALAAARDPGEFRGMLTHAREAPFGFVDEAAERGAARPPEVLLDGWRQGREELRRVLLAQPAGVRMPWFGPPMSVGGVASGRLMETWAHGQDVADALGVRRAPTARLRHVARIGVRTRDFAYAVHRLAPPAEEFRVELTAPGGGEVWAYGPEDAAERVTGPALDFCLLVTQRVHRADTALVAEGAEAERWLGIAQAFAGPPGAGRDPAPDGTARTGGQAARGERP